MDSHQQTFRDFLKSRRLKFTTERATILQTVSGFRRPFEAEELLLALQDTAVHTSKATVYRTIRHLLDAGLLRQVTFSSSKQTHYDFVTNQNPHDHLLDLDTGKIVPFSSEQITKIRDEIAKSLGYQALSHRFQITARRR